VDFWATWCGPCKTLTPTLEKVVRAAGGRVRLVKIDIDKNRQLVQQLAQMGLPLQSVPTVGRLRPGPDRRPLPGRPAEGEVKKFVETSEDGRRHQPRRRPPRRGQGRARGRRPPAGALQLFAALVEAEPENPEAFAGLARVLMAMGEEEQAASVLEQVPDKIKDHAEVASGPLRARSSRSRAARRRRSSASSSGAWPPTRTTTGRASTWPWR
jgi:putative thioredoxin